MIACSPKGGHCYLVPSAQGVRSRKGSTTIKGDPASHVRQASSLPINISRGEVSYERVLPNRGLSHRSHVGVYLLKRA